MDGGFVCRLFVPFGVEVGRKCNSYRNMLILHTCPLRCTAHLFCCTEIKSSYISEYAKFEAADPEISCSGSYAMKTRSIWEHIVFTSESSYGRSRKEQISE